MSYQIVLSAETRGRYQDLLAEARLHSNGPRLEEAYHQLTEELQRDGGLGEILYWLPTGRPIFHRVIGPLTAHYALYAAERVVWLFRLDPTPRRD